MTYEARRIALYNRWGEVLGPDHAETMMEMFNELATKNDISRLEDRFDQLESRLESRFDKIDERFEKIDERFEKIDARFQKIDERFEKIDERFEKIDERFERMDQRFVKIHERLDTSSEQFVGFYKNMVTTIIVSMTALTGIFAALLTVVR